MLLAEGLFELRGYGMNDWLTHNLYDTIIRSAQEGFPQCMLREGPLIMMANARGKPRFRKSLTDRTPPPRPKPPESLTPREQELLELIWAGLKNTDIGQRLNISVKTVDAHRANMMKKMRVSNAAQLLATAIQSSMLRIHEHWRCSDWVGKAPSLTARGSGQPRSRSHRRGRHRMLCRD